MGKYVLLRADHTGLLVKVSMEDFDEFFEGTPPPTQPMLRIVK